MAADPTKGDVTQLLQSAQEGDQSALERVLPLVYGELKIIAAKHMRSERDDHTLTPTAVLHEAFLRMSTGTPIKANDTAHFLRAASQIMRRVLVDHARARNAQKRDGQLRVTLDENFALPSDVANTDLIALDDALKELASAEPRWAQVVELRYFAGLEINEVASVLDVSPTTVKRDWQFAKAWLAQRLQVSSEQ